jgi:hypothetical protein
MFDHPRSPNNQVFVAHVFPMPMVETREIF